MLFSRRSQYGKAANPDALIKGGDTILLRGCHGVLRIPAGFQLRLRRRPQLLAPVADERGDGLLEHDVQAQHET